VGGVRCSWGGVCCVGAGVGLSSPLVGGGGGSCSPSVLFTPPPIPTGVLVDSRILTGLLLDLGIPTGLLTNPIKVQ